MATLNDDALTDLGAVEEEVEGYTQGSNQSDDDFVTDVINSLSREFREACRRVFHYRDQIKERVGTDGQYFLMVDTRPIDTNEPIEIRYKPDSNTDREVDGSDYSVRDADVGKIFSADGWTSTYPHGISIEPHEIGGQQLKSYEVTLSGGFVTPNQDPLTTGTGNTLNRDLPEDIERAVLETVTLRWHHAGDDTSLSSIAMGEGQISWDTRNGRRVPYSLSWEHAVDRYKERGV